MAALTTRPAIPPTTSSEPRATRERRCLRAGERRVVRAIAEAMFSEDGEVESARLDALVDEVDEHVTAASPMITIGMRLLLVLVHFAPALVFFRLSTLGSLSVADRVKVLSRLERAQGSGLSLVSLAFVGWRTVLTLVFYEDPVELQAIGYTSNERTRYKRALPLAVPVPAESGVRLKDVDSETDLEAAHDAGETHEPRVA
ncbi:MAG: hypothetical protein JST00_28475 [Deltaproteobacteria bacterium]|nr:hypothetical protein [Deltaproteobacteria bacterium]